MSRSLRMLACVAWVLATAPALGQAASIVPYDPVHYGAAADCVVEVDVFGSVPESTWNGRLVVRPVLGEVHVLRCQEGAPTLDSAPVVTLGSAPGHRIVGAVHWRPGRWRLYLKHGEANGLQAWGVLGLREGAHWMGPLSGIQPRFETDNRGPDETPLRWSDPASVGFVLTDTVASSLTLEGVEHALRDALDAWNAVGCSRLNMEFDGVVPSWSQGWGRRNHVAMMLDDFVFGGGPMVLGSTGVEYDAETGELLAASVLLNGVDVPWSLEGAAPGEWDVRGVIMHELGHAFGLAHTPVREAVMVGIIPSPLSRAIQQVHDDDVLGVCFLYPCDESAEACARPTPPSAPGTRDAGGLCAPCVSDGECGAARDRCDGTYCLRACSLMDPCPLGASCVRLEGVGTRQCVVDDARCERRTATACAPCSDEAPCAEGTCGEEGACLLSCSREVGCPAGFACIETSSHSEGVCLPEGQDACVEEPEEPSEPDEGERTRRRGGCAVAPGTPGVPSFAWVVLVLLAGWGRKRPCFRRSWAGLWRMPE